MENQQDNFIPPFQTVEAPKPKRPVALIVIAVVLFLGVLGLGTGLYMQMAHAQDLQRQVDDLKTAATKMDQQMAQDMNMGADQSAADFREVPELGVKYKVTDATKDLTYSYVSDDQGTVKRVNFSTLTLSQLKDDAGNSPCASSGGPSGSISELDNVDRARALYGADNTENTKKIGDHVFVYIQPQSACTDSTLSAGDLQASQDAVKTVFDSLEAM